MKIPLSRNGIQCGIAFLEFMELAKADIESAYGKSVERRIPSQKSLAVYDEVVRWQESINDPFDGLML